MVDLKASIPQAIWESEAISCQMSSLVHLDGHAYGIHGQAGGCSASQSTLFCLRIDRGKKVWEKKGYGLGSLILVDGTLVMLTENGELVLCRQAQENLPNSQAFRFCQVRQTGLHPLIRTEKCIVEAAGGIGYV